MVGHPADAGSHWDPDKYERFAQERARPGLDLLARAARLTHPGPHRVFDLGCGTGSLTHLMASRWREARITGVDHSEEMLERARASAPDANFVRADLATWMPDEPAGLLFANASLHWVPDHEELMPWLVRGLAPGGVLAVQMPLSWGQPSHRAMREVLAHGGEDRRGFGDEALRARLARRWVLEAEEYLELLDPVCSDVDIWETCYLHVLTGPEAILEWVKGTGLRPVLAALEGEPRERFLAAYLDALTEAYPAREDGSVAFRFKRLFFTARARR